MDQHTAERRYAHCSGLWAAARNRRRYRTNDIAQAANAAKTARRNQHKANLLTAIGEFLLVSATLAAGLTAYRLTQAAPYAGVILAIAVAFGTDRTLRPMLTDVFAPTIDRLRGLEPKGAAR